MEEKNEKNETNLNKMSKYWENQEVSKIKLTKKKVSFDDILLNMNIVVNKNGELQFMSPINVTPNQDLIKNQKQSQQLKNQEPLNSSVKYSYIYNKYFKDYQDANLLSPQVKHPKTKEEYNRMVLEERIKQELQKKRISEIKSKKLLFTGNSNILHIQSSKNNLKNMSFN
jgi:hypothetical protein